MNIFNSHRKKMEVIFVPLLLTLSSKVTFSPIKCCLNDHAQYKNILLTISILFLALASYLSIWGDVSLDTEV